MTIAEIRETLTELQVSLGNIQSTFNRTKYPVEFAAYAKKWEPFFMELEREYDLAEDKEGFLDSICDAVAVAAEERYRALNRRKREMIMLQDQLALVAYVFPAILDCRNSYSEALANKMCASWNDLFHMTLKTATYETINAGFTRKWCFITTAVCESLHKPDDCEELTMLRAYRDTYMASTEEGRELVRRYYDIAPTIVHKIDRRSDAGEIYSGIYEEHLIPCLDSIREGENERCLEQYRGMVESLEERYMYS